MTSSFFSALQNVFDSRPKTRYLVAVDDSQNTLEEIVRVSGGLECQGGSTPCCCLLGIVLLR